MVNHRLYRTPIILAGSLLLAVLCGTWSVAEVGQVAPAQGSKASAPSSAPATKSEPKKASAKKAAAQATTSKRAPAKKMAEVKPLIPKAKVPEIVGHRDPFRLPPPPGPEGAGAGEEIKGPLPPGIRGLVIGQLRVEGIVRLDLSNTMIGVVTNATNRAYFLRENDAVYNGVVSKITPDSIIFRENYLDTSGQVQVREVVKRLG